MSNKQIIVIPGIMGSELKYNEYKIWPPNDAVWWKGMHVISKKLGDIESKEVQSVGINKSYYGDLVNNLKNICNCVDIFHYDWRQNNFKHVKQLNNIIDPNADEVILVAHSMGGIISKLFLTMDIENSLSKKVTKLITLGTPFNGSVDAYITLEYGFGMKFIRGAFKSIIPKFESIYQLLPNKYYVDKNNTNYGIGYLDDKNWNDILKQNYLPMLKSNGLDSDIVLKNYYDIMNKELPSWVEHHEIIGYNIPTLTSINNEGLKVKGKYGNGDGTVPLHSAITATVNKYFINEKHKLLPRNKKVNEILNSIIIENKSSKVIIDEKNLPTYDEILNSRWKFKVVRVACPVDVSLINEEDEVIYGDINGSNDRNLIDIFLESDSDIKYLNDDVYFILEDNNDLKQLRVEAYEEGAVSISIDEYRGSDLEKTAKFKTFNMNDSNSAEIVVDNIIEQCNVELSDKEKNKKQISSIVIESSESSENILLPNTEYDIIGNNIKKIDENTYIATGDVYIDIVNVNKGTYEIMNTFYMINDGYSMVSHENEKIKIQLKEGKNTLKVYSTDIFDNFEDIKPINIVYIENNEKRIPKIHIKANPGFYNLTAEFYTNKEIDKLNIPEPQCEFIFDDYDDVYGSLVKNKGKVRSVNVKVTDIFGNVEGKVFKINEKILNNIFDSRANVKDYSVFLDQIGIEPKELKSYKVIVNSKTHIYKTLMNARLTDADLIEFKNNNYEVIIDKMKKYEVMFSNLKEYINLKEADIHEFEFSVFSNETLTHTDVKLNISMAIELESDIKEYKEVMDIGYNIIGDKYSFSLKSEDIMRIVYEQENVVQDNTALFILIKLDDDRKTVLRACELNIKE